MSGFKNKLAPDFSDGVDRKLLKQVRERFMRVNTDRLEKTYLGLSPKQRDILQVLPLLFQINHPMLPGYAGKEVPAFIAGYEPDKQVLNIAKSFSQTFKYRAEKRVKRQISSLFMMGSTGTLAHSERSDVDLWLCHEPELSPESLDALAEKAKKIDQWANSLGLEVHTFLMDAEKFKRGEITNRLDKESSGSAQHYLLLDEFYRTAILLAGKYPIWWLVPPDLEQRYDEITEMLLSKRFLKASEVVDFGSAARIPKNELVGAALWQLYKGIDSPYKSVLKILLAEVYAQEMPAKRSISQTLKQAIYDDELSVEDLDPYLLVYKRLEAYLLGLKDHKRLDLVRKSFYLKVAKKLSKPPQGRQASWQRLALEKLVRHWAWPEEKFRYLDNRHQWKVDQVLQERQAVVAELSYCYRFLTQYAHGQGIDSSMSSNDMSLLGRKLYSVFQKKAGKIERVNPGIAQNLWEENLAIHHASTQPFMLDNQGWLVYRNLNTTTDASFEPSLRRSNQLIELIAWLYFNQILSQSTRMSFVPGTSEVRFLEVQSILRALSLVLPVPLAPVSQTAFQKKLCVTHLLLFINVGVDPLKKMSEKGMHYISDRTDSLDFSTERQNLVKTIDQIAVNSWNEVMAHRYEMGDTLMQNLQSYLQICLDQHQNMECQLSVFCFCPQRAQAIAARVDELFKSIKHAFFAGRVVRAARYILEVEAKFYIFQYIDGQFRYVVCEDESVLLERLSQKTRQFSPVILDPVARLPSMSLAALLSLNQQGVIQVIYVPRQGSSGHAEHEHSSDVDVLVLDEFGSCFQFYLPPLREDVLQMSLSKCLQSLRVNRQMHDLAGADVVLQDIKIYRAWPQPKSGTSEVPFKLKEIARIDDYLGYDIQIHAVKEFDRVKLDVSFSGANLPYKDFSFQDYADQQFSALVHFIRQHKAFESRYPFQIVDISLSESSQASFGALQSMGTLDMFKVFAIAQQKLAFALEKQGIA